MGEIRCEICYRGLSKERGGRTVYRTNKKGIPGKWRCTEHLTQEAGKCMMDPRSVLLTIALEPEKSTQ